MQDRDIFMDVLAGTKHSINCYTNAIMETSNQQLRSTWQTLRDEAEQMQYQLYQMAEQKGFYVPAPPAHQEDVQNVKTVLTSAINGASSGKHMGMPNFEANNADMNQHMNMSNTNNMMNNNSMMNSADMGIPNNNNKVQNGTMPSNLSSSSNQGFTSSTSDSSIRNSKDRH